MGKHYSSINLLDVDTSSLNAIERKNNLEKLFCVKYILFCSKDSITVFKRNRTMLVTQRIENSTMQLKIKPKFDVDNHRQRYTHTVKKEMIKCLLALCNYRFWFHYTEFVAWASRVLAGFPFVAVIVGACNKGNFTWVQQLFNKR